MFVTNKSILIASEHRSTKLKDRCSVKNQRFVNQRATSFENFRQLSLVHVEDRISSSSSSGIVVRSFIYLFRFRTILMMNQLIQFRPLLQQIATRLSIRSFHLSSSKSIDWADIDEYSNKVNTSIFITNDVYEKDGNKTLDFD